MGRILPILFNGDMVLAILEGRKTVTRRVIKLPYCGYFENEPPRVIEPYQIDDILYVRETWAFIPCIGCNGDYIREGEPLNCYDYQAVEYDDGDSISDGCFLYRVDCKTPERISWRPSIHMPKQAARIWLKVTNVKVERLQEITIDGCEEEGCWSGHNGDIFAFMALWNSTIKKADRDRYGWNANPWVWVVEFEQCDKPEPCILNGIEPESGNRPCIGYQKSKEDDEPCEMCKRCKWCDGEEPESEG